MRAALAFCSYKPPVAEEVATAPVLVPVRRSARGGRAQAAAAVQEARAAAPVARPVVHLKTHFQRPPSPNRAAVVRAAVAEAEEAAPPPPLELPPPPPEESTAALLVRATAAVSTVGARVVGATIVI